MKKKYFVKKDFRQIGPYTIDQIIKLNLKDSFSIWTDGMDDWIELENINALKDYVFKQNIDISPSKEPTLQNNETNFDPTDFLDYNIAPISKRFFANFLNTFIMWSIVIAILLIIDPNSDSDGNESILLLYGLKLIYLFTYSTKIGNIGHILLKLKVVYKDTGEDFNKPIQGLIRELIKSVLFPIIIPVIWLLFDKDKQNFYDKIFATVVVEEKIQKTRRNDNI